jgi:hypothetical protein
MSKTSKKSAEPTPETVAKKTVEAPGAARTIVVTKKEAKYKGARASWYAALLAHDGQTNIAFVNACTKNPPAMLKSGKAEDPHGWLRFFVRIGVATLS